jgi:hypothetical protein
VAVIARLSGFPTRKVILDMSKSRLKRPYEVDSVEINLERPQERLI